MNNAELIDGLRRREPSAAQHLNECYVPVLWRFVFHRVDRDAHLAEDIVSETVLALVTAASADNEIENPGGWMRTVAQRRIQDHYRAVARVRHVIENASHTAEPTDETDPSRVHDEQLRRESVREAVDTLPEHYRLALEWKYVDRVRVKVIAERLETTIKSVEGILFRARQALRSRLKSEHAMSAPPAEQIDNTGPETDHEDSPQHRTSRSLEQASAWFFS